VESPPLRRITCKEVVDLANEYTEELLESEIAVDYAAHLTNCPDCRRFFDSYRQTIRLAAGAYSDGACSPGQALPESLARAILAAGPRART
jgi:predicted anti-sigma-YlaC factor YlaD